MTTSDFSAMTRQALRASVEVLNSTNDAVGGNVALGSGLFWACSLDEHLRRVSPGHEAMRDADDDGRLLPALRLARNAVMHGAVVAAVPTEGIAWPLRFPLTWQHLAYRPLSEINESWVGTRHMGDAERQDALYVSHLEGARVVESIESALRWFERVHCQLKSQ